MEHKSNNKNRDTVRANVSYKSGVKLALFNKSSIELYCRHHGGNKLNEKLYLRRLYARLRQNNLHELKPVLKKLKK